jgi:hypothetical protein
MTTRLIPIFDNRTQIGTASSEKHAERFLRRTLDIHPMFQIKVWRRSNLIGDILQLPDGYVYSIGFLAQKRVNFNN